MFFTNKRAGTGPIDIKITLHLRGWCKEELGKEKEENLKTYSVKRKCNHWCLSNFVNRFYE